MKRVLLAALLVSAAAVAMAQTASKPASTPAAKPVAHATAPAASGIKLPPDVPAVKGILKTAFSLKYQDVKIGAGAIAEPNKVYQVHYTGWLAADGRKFDSSHDHPASPVIDSTGKPVMGADGKPKQEAGQPIRFIQGVGRVIPGWDQGFEGMKIGGKRRLFIPWQLALWSAARPPHQRSQESRHSPQGRPHLRCRTAGCDRYADAAQPSAHGWNAWGSSDAWRDAPRHPRSPSYRAGSARDSNHAWPAPRCRYPRDSGRTSECESFCGSCKSACGHSDHPARYNPDNSACRFGPDGSHNHAPAEIARCPRMLCAPSILGRSPPRLRMGGMDRPQLLTHAAPIGSSGVASISCRV